MPTILSKVTSPATPTSPPKPYSDCCGFPAACASPTSPWSCTGCGTRLDDIWAYYATAFPHQKAALLSYTADTVLPTFYGLTTAEFTMGLDEEIMTMFEPTTNLKYFTFTGAGHVLWFTPSLTTNGVTVQQFLTLMVNDDPTWTSEE